MNETLDFILYVLIFCIWPNLDKDALSACDKLQKF